MAVCWWGQTGNGEFWWAGGEGAGGRGASSPARLQTRPTASDGRGRCLLGSGGQQAGDGHPLPSQHPLPCPQSLAPISRGPQHDHSTLCSGRIAPALFLVFADRREARGPLKEEFIHGSSSGMWWEISWGEIHLRCMSWLRMPPA